MRIFLLLLSILTAADSFCQSHTPSREVEATDDGIIVTYRFNGGVIQDDPLRSDAQLWKIPGFTQNEIAGEPSVPFKCDMFSIPDNVEVNVELIDSAFTGSAVLKVGNHVTTTKPVGNVVIDGADIKIKGRNVEIHPGTAVINSKVSINPQD